MTDDPSQRAAQGAWDTAHDSSLSADQRAEMMAGAVDALQKHLAHQRADMYADLRGWLDRNAHPGERLRDDGVAHLADWLVVECGWRRG